VTATGPIVIDGLSHDEWLAARQHGVGASEIATVLGLGYADDDPAQLYRRKVAGGPCEMDLGQRGELGLVLEPYNAAQYVKATGAGVQKGPSLVLHRERPWQLSSLDYLVGGDLARPLELKAVFGPPAFPWGESGTDRVPEKFLLQVTQQGGIVGAGAIELSVLFVGYCHRTYVVPFDPDLYRLLTEAGGEFWRRVEGRDPVGPDWRPACVGAVADKLAGVREGLEVKLDEGAEAAAREYAEIGKLLREAEKQKQRARDRLLCAMGEAGVGRLPSGGVVQRKVVKTSGYTVEPGEHLRVSVRLDPRSGGES
jgi:putative phage-type endonuclease